MAGGVNVAAEGRVTREDGVRLRVVVVPEDGPTAGLEGVSQKQVFVHDDPTLVAGMPKRIAGAGTASPVFADVEPGGGQEMVLATDDGRVHVYRADLTEIPGFPVKTDRAPWWVNGPTATVDGIPSIRSGIGVGAPVVTDLNGDEIGRAHD